MACGNPAAKTTSRIGRGFLSVEEATDAMCHDAAETQDGPPM